MGGDGGWGGGGGGGGGREGGERGYGLDVHDGIIELGICGGVVMVEGKGALCEVSVDRVYRIYG